MPSATSAGTTANANVISSRLRRRPKPYVAFLTQHAHIALAHGHAHVCNTRTYAHLFFHRAQTRDEDRDVSEKIALGLKPTGGAGAAGGDAMIDQRLFNQSSGMDSGFGADESYNLYDKPLFAGTSMNQYVAC